MTVAYLRVDDLLGLPTAVNPVLVHMTFFLMLHYDLLDGLLCAPPHGEGKPFDET
jgi:hypothetical protein